MITQDSAILTVLGQRTNPTFDQVEDDLRIFHDINFHQLDWEMPGNDDLKAILGRLGREGSLVTKSVDGEITYVVPDLSGIAAEDVAKVSRAIARELADMGFESADIRQMNCDRLAKAALRA